VQFNKNSFGLVPESPAALAACLPQQIMPGTSGTGCLPVVTSGPLADTKGVVQMAIKTNLKVSYFQDVADLTLFLTADGRLEQQAWLSQWKTLADGHVVQTAGVPPPSESVEAVCPKFEAQSIFFIARRDMRAQAGTDNIYFSAKSFNGHVLLAEVALRPGTGQAQITVKSAQPQYVPLLASSLEKVLKA